MRYLVEEAGADRHHRQNIRDTSPDLDGVTPIYGIFSFGVTKEQSLAIIQLLLDAGADPHAKNALGFTPITVAAYYSDLNVLDFLLERNEIGRMETIDALELVGAFIIRDGKVNLMDKAFRNWRKSLKLRLIKSDGFGPIIKT